jgi:hypothetical protein
MAIQGIYYVSAIMFCIFWFHVAKW